MTAPVTTQACRDLAAEVMEIVNRYRPGSASADQMHASIRALAEDWAEKVALPGPDPQLVAGLAALLHDANNAALLGLSAETQAARIALCRILGIEKTATPLREIESRIRAALAGRDSSQPAG